MSANFGSILAHPPFDAVADPRKYFHLEDDFVTLGTGATGIIGAGGWRLVGAGGTATQGTSSAEHPGVLLLTAATTDFSAALAGGVDSLFVGENGLYFGTQVLFPSAVTNTVFRAGFVADTAALEVSPTTWAGVEFDSANEATFTFNVDDNSTDTEVVGATTVAADTWYTVEVVVTATDAQGYVNGYPVGDPVTASALGSTTGLTPYISIGDGTNGDTLAVDWVAVRQRVNRAGFTAE